MRDARKNIIGALIPAIKTKLPSADVYTKINKPVDGTSIAYPYIYISDIYQNESGSKARPIYDVEALIQVVYKDINSLVDLWDDMNAVTSIIDTKRDITLTDNFKLMLLELVAISEEEIQTDTGILNIGLVRINFKIEDNN